MTLAQRTAIAAASPRTQTANAAARRGGLPVGTVRSGAYLGLAPGRWIWAACPRCGRRRWKRVGYEKTWCRYCCFKHPRTAAKKKEVAGRGARRVRYLCALGRAAEKCGWRPPGWVEPEEMTS